MKKSNLKTRRQKEDLLAKKLISNLEKELKKENVELAKVAEFEDTLTEMILKVSPHGTSYYVKQKIQKPKEETNSKPQQKPKKQ